MPHNTQKAVSGIITDVFAHRFVVETDTGRILADVTPQGIDKVRFKAGDRVTLSGEMKPSELKVERFERNGEAAITIGHGGPDHGPADPAEALRTAASQGYKVFGEPRRKPKHFEILGRDRSGSFAELHIELDGTLRKIKEADHDKWADALAAGRAAAAGS